MALGGRGRRQQWLPKPNWADSLWRGCLWAINANYYKGFHRSALPNKCQRDDITRKRGELTNGSATNVIRTYDAGRFVWPGPLTDTSVVFQDPGTKWQWPPNQVSIACLMRFNELPAVDSRIIGKYRDTPVKGGVKLVYVPTLGNTIKFGWCDGVIEELITSTTVPNTNTTYLLVGTISSSPTRRAELWVNGSMENSMVPTIDAANSAAPIELFYDPTVPVLVPILAAKVAMAGLWGRPLTHSEIARLNTNPYVMWLGRDEPKSNAFGNLGLITGCHCPGYLRHWYGMA